MGRNSLGLKGELLCLVKNVNENKRFSRNLLPFRGGGEGFFLLVSYCSHPILREELLLLAGDWGHLISHSLSCESPRWHLGRDSWVTSVSGINKTAPFWAGRVGERGEWMQVENMGQILLLRKKKKWKQQVGIFMVRDWIRSGIEFICPFTTHPSSMHPFTCLSILSPSVHPSIHP